MSKANKFDHVANLDVQEVCEFHYNYQTYDKTYIRKILVANIDPTTPYKLLYNTFAKFGQITHCILKKQKQFVRPGGGGPGNQEGNQDGNQGRNEKKTENNIVKSYAFITYYTHLEAQRALEAGQNRRISIKKQYLRVVPANSWHQPDNLDAYNKTCYVCKHQASAIHPSEALPKHYFFRLLDESIFSELNNDCLRRIFNFLPFYDRVRVERVSRRWKAVSEEAWHDQHKLDFNADNWGQKKIDKQEPDNQEADNQEPDNQEPDKQESDNQEPELKKEKFKNIDSCSVYKITKRCCPFITHIDLSKCSNQLGNSILIELAQMCILVQHINLDNFIFKRTGIRALADNCKSLKSITLGYFKSNYKFDKELSLLFSRNENLEKVELDCFMIDGKCLYHLPKQHMQKLILRNANYLLENGIFKFIRKMPNLRVLNVFDVPEEFEKYGDFIKCISICSKLEVLKIPLNEPLDSSNLYYWKTLEPLTRLNNLTKINLKGNCMVYDIFLEHLSTKCQKLKSIDISDCPNIRDTGLGYITSLPRLEYLCIEKLKNVSDGVFMKRMPNIKILLCSGCTNFRSFGLSFMIQSANKLELLDLTNCTHVCNDFVIDAMRRCKRTRRIWSRCLKVYLKGTKAVLAGMNLRYFWNFLQLMDEERVQRLQKMNEISFTTFL